MSKGRLFHQDQLAAGGGARRSSEPAWLRPSPEATSTPPPLLPRRPENRRISARLTRLHPGWTSITLGDSNTTNPSKIYTVALTTTNPETITISAVPEPGTIALLAGGLFGLLAYAWRKRKWN